MFRQNGSKLGVLFMAKRQAKSSIDHWTRLIPRTDISFQTQNEIMKRGYPEEQYKIPDDFRPGDVHGRLTIMRTFHLPDNTSIFIPTK